MHLKNRKGQSTVEYVLLMTAVIAVIIALVASNNSGLQGQLGNTINSAASQIGTLSDRLTGSENASQPSSSSTPPYTVNVAAP